MGFIRHITSTFLVVMMVLLTGLGGAAHALAMGCTAGHCEGLLSAPNNHHQAGQADDMIPAGDMMPDPDSPNLDGCDPTLCQTLFIVLPPAVTFPAQFDRLVAWQYARARTLLHADTPVRPPNL